MEETRGKLCIIGRERIAHYRQVILTGFIALVGPGLFSVYWSLHNR
jgi:hypothetical protein